MIADVARTLAAALVFGLVTPLPVAAQTTPSTRDVVSAARRYVASYQTDLAFLLAEESTSQVVAAPDGRSEAERQLHGEAFLTFLPAERAWIWVHDVDRVDGRAVAGHEDLRALLQRESVRGLAQTLSNRNARFNIGSITRNFSEPTLALLLLGDDRAPTVKFDLASVERIDGRTVATLTFRETARPALVHSEAGQPLYSRGELVVDAASGRIERSTITIKDGHVTASLATTFRPDEKLALWVPATMSERYERTDRGRRELVTCETVFSNYRRFEVTGRIK